MGAFLSFPEMFRLEVTAASLVIRILRCEEKDVAARSWAESLAEMGGDDGEHELRSPPNLHRNRSSSFAFHDLHQVISKSIHSCPCHLHTQWLVLPGKVASIILCLRHFKPFSVMKICRQCCPCSSWRLLAQSVLLFSPLDSVWHTQVTYSAWLLHRPLCARTCHSNVKLLGWGNPTLPSIDLLGNDSFIGCLTTQVSKGTCVWTFVVMYSICSHWEVLLKLLDPIFSFSFWDYVIITSFLLSLLNLLCILPYSHCLL